MSRKQKRRQKHDHKSSMHVSGEAMHGKVLVLEGEDVPLDANATIDLVTEGKKFPDGKPRFHVRDANPMRAFTRKETLDYVLKNETGIANSRTPPGGPTGAFRTGNREISFPVDAVTRARLSSIKRAGETDDDAISRLFSHEGAIKALPGTDEFEIATLISEAVRDAGPLHIAPHGTLERVASDTLSSILNAVPQQHRIPTLLKALESPSSRKTILNSSMSTFAAERLRGAMATSGGQPAELLGGKSDAGTMGSERKGIDADKEYLAVLEDVADMVANPVLGKVTDSCFHKVVEKWRAQEVLIPIDQHGNAMINRDRCEKLAGKMQAATAETGIFLLQHDWAAAFAKAKDFDGGEIQLPYAQSVFECLIGGHRVVVSIAHGSDDMLVALLHIQAQGRWALGGIYHILPGSLTPDPGNQPDMCTPLIALLVAQIRAVCIALEAEVAQTEVIRAPHRLNQKRERKGQLPLYDYHVVSLANRRRYPTREPLPGDIEDEHRHRRLHFVRGHWRHYSNIKTWIRWHMRGDIDLGFVDKEYRL